MAKGLQRTIGPLATSGVIVKLKSYTVATVPPAASHTGCMIYVTNGAAGSPCMAVSNGTNWLRCDSLAAVATE